MSLVLRLPGSYAMPNARPVPFPRFTLLPLATAVLLAGCGDSGTPAPAQPAPSATGSPFAPAPGFHGRSLNDEQIAAFNRGVGQMGAFEFEEAERTFDALIPELGPTHPFARLAKRNLAIARLNQTSDGSQERATELLEPLLADDPSDVTSHYCMGLIRLFLGEPDRATAHFRVAAEADPNDAYAAYYMGQCLEFDGKPEEARRWYETSARLDPYLRSPLLGLQRIESRAGNADAAAKQLELFQAMADNPRAKLAEFKYTRMGRKAEATVPAIAGSGTQPAIGGDPFVVSMATVVGEVPWRESSEGEAASLTAADIDGDGRSDLFAASALAGGRSAVLLSNADGEWRWVEGHPLAATTAVRAALWGDLDDDGDLDVYLCHASGGALYLGDGRGGYTDVTEASGAGMAGRALRDGTIADLDHDGDCDLYLVAADGANELLANQGAERSADGASAPVRFRAIGAESGARGDGRPTRAVVVHDLDSDRDADLLLLHDTPPHELLRNERLWRWTPMTEPHPLLGLELDGAIAGDWNADGMPSILAVDPQGALRMAGLGRSGPSLTTNEDAQIGVAADRGFAAADVTGTGAPNLLWREDHEFAVGSLDGSPVARAAFPPGAGTPLAWTLLTRGLEGPSAVVLTTRGLIALDPGPKRGGYATLRFAGRTEASQSMRSNAGGIGTIFAARVGDRWIGGDTFRAASTRGQSAQPVSIGVANATQIDFISMEWSDGVFQSELDVPARVLTTITETQRQISSCPVIFAWDGDGHRFVTDCLGVGGIGYLVAPGEYAPPRPWERVLLPASIAYAPRDGAYEFLLGEPMEEACYLDAARLVAYDLPAGWSMTVDDRMGIAGPEPTGEPRFFRSELRPTSVTDERGGDHTAATSEVDGVAAALEIVDPRLIGYLRASRTLTLTFASPLDRLPGEPTLVAHGWVEYPYCQTNFAAWQEGVTSIAPDLEARGADGVWRRVYPSWGYPAGMTREMSLPLRGLPEGTTALRMTSNLEIYWDAFSVVGVEACPEVRRTELPLTAAALRDGGFAERVHRPQKRPDYDASRRAPLWDTRHQPGLYTAFGPCRELVESTDDAVLIFGPGEEVTLRFAADAAQARPALNPNERRLILEVDGWCKDFDLFTRDGETLGPLPTRSGHPLDATSHAAELHRRLNTRYRDGR